MLDAHLVCESCAAGYPVVEGVATILSDPSGAEPGSADDDVHLSTWLWSDYGRNVAPLPDGLRSDPHPIELLLPHLELGARVLDLGCGTGGATFAAAGVAGFTLGIERSPARVAAAIELRRTGRLRLPLATAQGHVQAIELAPAGVREAPCDFLVADIVDPPLAPELWDAVVLGMVYDVVRAPGLLLGQAGALLRTGGLLLQASPYQFGQNHDFRPEDPGADLRVRLGTGAHGTAFCGLLEEERLWVLRDNARRFFAYRLDVVLGRKLSIRG